MALDICPSSKSRLLRQRAALLLDLRSDQCQRPHLNHGVLQHPHDQKTGAALSLLLFLLLLSKIAWGWGVVADSTSSLRSPLFHMMVSARLIENLKKKKKKSTSPPHQNPTTKPKVLQLGPAQERLRITPDTIGRLLNSGNDLPWCEVLSSTCFPSSKGGFWFLSPFPSVLLQ